MIPYIFNGPPVILGYHGHVNTGDTIWLPEAEANDIKDDPRFIPFTGEAAKVMFGKCPQEEAEHVELGRYSQPELVEMGQALSNDGYPIIARGSDEKAVLIRKIIEARRFSLQKYTGKAAEVAEKLAKLDVNQLIEFCQLVQGQGKPISWNHAMSKMELIQGLVNSKAELFQAEPPPAPAPIEETPIAAPVEAEQSKPKSKKAK